MRNLIFVVALLFSKFSIGGVIDLGAAADYTLFIKETYQYTTGDVQGYSAIGGEITNASGQAEYFGQMIDELNISAPPTILNSTEQFENAFAHLTQLSQELANKADTGTVSKPWSSKLQLEAAPGTGSDQIHYFSFDVTDLLNVTEIALNGFTEGQVVINVTGETIDTSWGGQFVNGVHLNYSDANLAGRAPVEILYNFVDATHIEVDGTLYASILAPTANVIGSNSFTQWGQLIANSWKTGSATQFNYDPLSPTSPDAKEVSEPNLFFLLLVASRFLVWRSRKAVNVSNSKLTFAV